MVELKQNGKHISPNEVDVLVAEFWGVPVHPRRYASPNNTIGGGWADVIRECAEQLQYFFSQPEVYGPITYHFSCKPDQRTAEFEMDHVARMILFKYANYCESADEIYEDVMEVRPYVELCFHLKSLGITVEASW